MEIPLRLEESLAGRGTAGRWAIHRRSLFWGLYTRHTLVNLYRYSHRIKSCPGDSSAIRSTGPLRMHVSALRLKLSDSAEKPVWILSERGVGYRMAGPGDVATREAGPAELS